MTVPQKNKGTLLQQACFITLNLEEILLFFGIEVTTISFRFSDLKEIVVSFEIVRHQKLNLISILKHSFLCNKAIPLEILHLKIKGTFSNSTFNINLRVPTSANKDLRLF